MSCCVQLDVVMAGDDVKKKKPDPMIYNLAKVLPIYLGPFLAPYLGPYTAPHLNPHTNLAKVKSTPLPASLLLLQLSRVGGVN